MRADPTLVQAAFTEAESRAKALFPDMSKVFQSNIDISRRYTTDIQSLFKEMKEDEKADKVARENQLKGFKTKLEAARKHILDQQQPLPMKVHDVNYDRLKELQSEFELVNTYGKDDNPRNEKMRAQLDAKLQKIINGAIDARGKLGQIAALRHSISSSSDKESMAIADAIFDFENYATNDNLQMSFNENDDLVWNVNLPGYWSEGAPGTADFSSWDEKQSWTIKDLENNLVIKDFYTTKDGKTLPVGHELGRYDELYTSGKTTNDAFDRESEIADIKNNILFDNSENMFKAMAVQEFDGNPSFRSSLLESPDIARSAIEHLFIEDIQLGFSFEDMDQKPDGIINEQDVINLTPEEKHLWKNNYREIVKALTDPSHRAFNFSLSEDMLAEFMADYRLQSFNEGRRLNADFIEAAKNAKPINKIDTEAYSIKFDDQGNVAEEGWTDKSVTGLKLDAGDFNLQGSFLRQYFPDSKFFGNEDYKVDKDGMVWTNPGDNTWVDMPQFQQEEPDIYSQLIDVYNKRFEKSIYVTPHNIMKPLADGDYAKIRKLGTPGAKIGGTTWAKAAGILSYDGSGWDVIKKLNKEYKEYGFTFSRDAKVAGGFTGDALNISFSHPLVNNGEAVKYSDSVKPDKQEYDNMSETDDRVTANAIMKWMIARVKEVEDVITKDRIGKEKITEWKP